MKTSPSFESLIIVKEHILKSYGYDCKTRVDDPVLGQLKLPNGDVKKMVCYLIHPKSQEPFYHAVEFLNPQ